VILARECYGDAILMTPMIKALKTEFPETSITMVAFTKIIYDFFSFDSNVSATYHAKRNVLRYLSKLLPRTFDVLFNPKNHPSRNFYLQSRLIRAKYKVGYHNTNHDELYDYLIDNVPGTHESVKHMALLVALGKKAKVNHRPYVPEMPLSGEAVSFIGKLATGTFIGINISTGTPGGRRTIEQWSELVKNFPEEQFVFFSSPDDIGKKRALEQTQENILPSPATKNLYEVLKMVEKLKLLITPDTSLVHVASCSDTPVLALYRYHPSHSIEFSPLSTQHEIIVSSTSDVVDINNGMVLTAAERMLGSLKVSSVY